MIARWIVQDPVTHFNVSPYVAFDNNPVYFSNPEGTDSRDPIKENVITIISSVDKNNVTHITQTNTTSTTIINDDGSVNVSYSTLSISNTVDAEGNVTNGNTVTQSSGTLSTDSKGNLSSTKGKTTSRNANTGDSSSALEEWTNTVSSYNKSNNNGVYNVDMINKTADGTNRAAKAGVTVLGSFTAINSIFSSLSDNSKSFLDVLGSYTSAEGLVGTAGDALKSMVGENNKYTIIYGVQHIQNGTLMKPMKTPSGNGTGERKRVGPTSWQGLYKAIKNLF